MVVTILIANKIRDKNNTKIKTNDNKDNCTNRCCNDKLILSDC